jgi:cytochrome c553
MRTIITLLVAVLGFGSSLAFAEGTAAAGKTHYATCVACHGDQGQGNPALNAPRLNHLEPVYLAAQLQKFRGGIRGGESATATSRQMAPMAAMLTDEQAVLDVSAYAASLDSGKPAATIEGDATLGGDYYNQFCGACHGAGAVGNVALNSPRLAGSSDWYLLAQLKAFRSGERGAHPQDNTGKQMRAMALILPNDQALNDVVAYLASLDQD